MADLSSIEKQEREDDHDRTKSAILVGVDFVVYAVVGFCEVLYVAMLISAFPDGLVRLVAIGGACATGISAVLLLKGKLYWFTKGEQSWIAWAFAGIEVTILALNVMLAVQLHNGHVADWLVFWEGFYPAAPVVALVGWGFILFTDQSNVMRTRRREQNEKQETAEMDYERLVHATKMEVQHASLQILSDKLQAKISSTTHSAGLDKIADEISNAILGKISGQHVSSLLPPASSIVDADASQPGTPVQINAVQQDLHDWLYTYMGSTDQQSGVPFLSWLEDLGAGHVNAETLAVARKLYPLKPSQSHSPLQQPIYDATNGNGHSPK